jgi:hypothetical protein
MNGLQIIRAVTDSLSFEGLLRLELEKTASGASEQRNIDPKQITSGNGTVDGMQYTVPAQVADKLNEIPNPDRNGLILLWSYNIYRILDGRESGIMDFLRHLYNLGEIQYSMDSKRGRKRKDQEDEIQITLEMLKLPAERPSGMSNIDNSEYERLRRFVDQCMIPSLMAFQKRWSAMVLNKSIHFSHLALNLLKGVNEIRTINQSG